MPTRKIRLTKRILEGIVNAAGVAGAGATEDFFGIADDESDEKIEAILDAGAWAQQELDRREKHANT